jgi:hypothetical protein
LNSSLKLSMVASIECGAHNNQIKKEAVLRLFLDARKQEAKRH